MKGDTVARATGSGAAPVPSPHSEFGSGLLRRLAGGGDGLLAWVVAVPDVDPVARRLGTTITTLSRVGLSARLAGVGGRLDRWLDSSPLPVRVQEGPPALRAVGIGDRAFR